MGHKSDWIIGRCVRQSGEAVTLDQQEIGYRAILKTFGRSARVQAIYWWKWFTDPDTREEWPVGYSPRGKPAGQVLRRACAPAPVLLGPGQ